MNGFFYGIVVPTRLLFFQSASDPHFFPGNHNYRKNYPPN